MGQWVSSREFAKAHSVKIDTLYKTIQRNSKCDKKICKIIGKFCPILYANGHIGGNSGKVLRIWSEPFKTQAEAEAFMESYAQERVDSLFYQKHPTLGSTQVAHPNTEYAAYLSNTDSAQSTAFIESHTQTNLTTPTTPHKIGTSNYKKERVAHNKAFISSSESIHLDTSKNEYASDDRDTDDVLSALKQDSHIHSHEVLIHTCKNPLSAFAKSTQKQQHLALEKKSIIKEWEAYKARGVNAKDFIALTNAGGQYSITLSENKLYAWQRAYKQSGINGLLDERGKNRKEQSKIKELGLEELTNKLILASRGRVNISSLHRMLHIHLDSLGKIELADFLAKRDEVISYCVLERYVKAYLKAHPIEAKIISRGEDAAVGNFLPALGQSNYAVDSINQIVEIDATSIDAIIDTSEIARALGLKVENIESWQKRFVLISLIDTYSGVCSFHISDTENALGVSRAIAKYITTYGKPKCIKSDNGSAFVSKYIKEVLMRLEIEHIKAKAYAGWCKPYVERNFARLQNHLMEWIKGYIEHSVSQRQAIEFFFSRAQRRLKRGQKSNQTNLHTLKELGQMIDIYTQSFMNNAYLERLNATPTEAYNARVDEAVRIHEYELIARLSPLERRAVNKKGIAYGGLWYQSAAMFAHTSVFVAVNINNTKELFMYDEQHRFIGVASNLDSEEMSAEMARNAQKIFYKELKARKGKMQEARAEVEAQFPQMLLQAHKKMPKTHMPKLKAINDSNLYQAKLLDEARKKAAGDGILDTTKEVKNEAQTKNIKDVSWEAAVLKRG